MGTRIAINVAMRSTLRLAFCGVLAGASLGCFTPFTDIVATNTEEVGDYQVIGTAASDGFTATVCADEPQRAAAIARRIVFQLHNHDYGSIDLDIVHAGAGQNAAATHVAWTPDGGTRVTSGRTTGRTACPHRTS